MGLDTGPFGGFLTAAIVVDGRKEADVVQVPARQSYAEWRETEG